jgi:hypothetical protein
VTAWWSPFRHDRSRASPGLVTPASYRLLAGIGKATAENKRRTNRDHLTAAMGRATERSDRTATGTRLAAAAGERRTQGGGGRIAVVHWGAGEYNS